MCLQPTHARRGGANSGPVRALALTGPWAATEFWPLGPDLSLSFGYLALTGLGPSLIFSQ